MGYDQKTAERVRRILSGRPDVVEKKMVGGLSFSIKGAMCCGVTSTGLMVRVGADARDQVLAQPHVKPMEFAGHPLAGFVCINPSGYRTEKQLAAWVERGVDFASSLPSKKR
jgi:TfoX/Sxy family transcriptional regulator of competence genes